VKKNFFHFFGGGTGRALVTEVLLSVSVADTSCKGGAPAVDVRREVREIFFLFKKTNKIEKRFFFFFFFFFFCFIKLN
jgi:hypothetical protein